MPSAQAIQTQISEAFNRYAREGLEALRDVAPDNAPLAEIGHICLKFTSLASYNAYVDAAHALGPVAQEEFNGKQISWCRLKEPLKNGGLTVEWMEMVEPKLEQNDYDGVTSIGYRAKFLTETLKIPSADGAMTFRFQPHHAHP